MKLVAFVSGLVVTALAVDPASIPGMPVGPPQPPPAYMVDNTRNYFGVAPDKNILNGPVTALANVTEIIENTPEILALLNGPLEHEHERRQLDTYWLANVPQGNMPFASSDYKYYRNVKDYGAKGDGKTDDTAAINLAASSGNRCGQACGSTTITGALVYFPPGTYLISSPIIQYYYTQFVGNPNTRPTIKGSANFSGIALIDNDVYIPGGNGDEWYINQNQFYRQIRNFVFDLTSMNRTINQGGQQYAPTGIHWQVAQATSLQNLHFEMSVSDAAGSATGVGIFMENGSGGFVSDLTFKGGNIGWRAGSQQFTARNLYFFECLTAVSMIWDWGFTWKNVTAELVYIAFDMTAFGGVGGQGTGSVSIVDSHFINVPYAITTHAQKPYPNIVIDNLLVEGNTPSVVLVSGGATVLEGTTGPPLTIGSWSLGRRYTNIDGTGADATGYLTPTPNKPSNLLDSSGRWFAVSKPQYETLSSGDFIIATSQGISNDGTGDQHGAINTMLANAGGKPVFFPAGIYLVSQTVFIPKGSIIVGSGWSQIMGTGSYFEDASNPQVMVKVGNSGDVGSIQISDMLFTVKGPTAGAILVEWNVHESTQGSAAMWDCHFRVGGAIGTNLQMADCPKSATTVNPKCEAASMLMHVTSESSGYFENVWAWVADHDIDEPPNGNTTSASQIDIYSGRGILVESQGPTWLYGTASEHSVLYQYQLLKAKDIFLGCMQTETPYFQPSPPATSPYSTSLSQFPSDPTFEDCVVGSNCQEAWALRVLNSSDIFIYGAGFYSFFSDYSQTCVPLENCQLKIFDTSYTQGLWVYNIFTKGVVQIASPQGGILPIFQNDSNQSGYTSEIAVWIPLSETGADIGGSGENGGGSGIVYIDPSVWSSPSPSVSCEPPCILVFPPLVLSTTTTITLPPYTTSLLQSFLTTRTTTLAGGSTSLIPGYSVVSKSTVITFPPITTTAIDVWEQSITTSQSTPYTVYMTSSIDIPTMVVTYYPAQTTGGTTTVAGPITTTITPPPYPWSTTTHDPRLNTHTTTWAPGPPRPTCLSGCGHPCRLFCHGPCLFCPPDIGGSLGGGGGGGGGDNGNDDSSSECETETSSICSTATVGGSTTVTCGSTVGCSVTSSDTSGGIQPATGVSGQFENWPATQTDDTASDLSVESSLASAIQTVINSDYPGGQASGGGSSGGGGGGSSPTSTPPTGPTGTAPPEATCSIAGQVDSEDVAIWTNYVTDNGAALEAAVSSACALLKVSNWKAYSSTNTYTDDNGVKWAANNEFEFSLGLARAPQQLECVNTGIKNAGGNPNNPACDFHAVLDPPDREFVNGTTNSTSSTSSTVM